MFNNILKGMLSKEMLYLILYDIFFLLYNVLAYKELKGRKIKKVYIHIIVLVGIIIGTFGKLGMDYESYRKIITLGIKKEAFYNILTLLSNKNINIYYSMVMIMNFILLYYIAKILKIKYKYFYISFFITFYFLDSINIIRSIQAQLISLIGFSFYLNKKKIKSYIIIILTLLFHKSSLINLIFLKFSFLKKITISKIICSIVIGILFNKVFKEIVSIFLKNNKYLIYIIGEKVFTIRWWFLNIGTISIKVLLILYFLFKFQKNIRFYKNYKSLIKILITGILSYIIILFMDVSPYVYQRIIIVIMSLNIILLPKFLEYTYMRKKELFFYYTCVFLIFILNNLQIIRVFYSRIIQI